MPRPTPPPAPGAADINALLARLTAAGDNPPPAEELLEIVQALRGASPEAAGQVDAWLVEELARYRDGLLAAREHQAHLRDLLERLSATPWHPAVYLGPAPTPQGDAAIVAQNGVVRVVGLAHGLSVADLGVGEDVFLGQNLNVVMARAERPVLQAGDTAEFQRTLPDGRLVLKHRDEEVVVRPAASLDAARLVVGDHVRWDRPLALAFERIERTHQSSLFLEEMPAEGFEAIGGLDREIARLQASLRLHMFHPDVVRRYQLRPAGSVLLVGPPGTGKTMIARALAHWIGRHAPAGRARFMNIKPGALHSVWYSQSEANYREAFRVAREAAALEPGAPVVMFFDEVDAIGAARSDAALRVDDRVLTSFMAELDGLEARGQVLVVAATNRRDAVDPALLRPGRLGDLVLEVPRPGAAAARAILAKHLPAGLPYAGGEAGEETGREPLIDALVSRLYAPNGEGAVATLVFRDGTRRPVHARDLVSGATLAKLARVAIERACQRAADGLEPGVRVEDAHEAAAEELDAGVAALTPANCHVFLSDLPQDLAVVRVERAARARPRRHRFIAAA